MHLFVVVLSHIRGFPFLAHGSYINCILGFCINTELFRVHFSIQVLKKYCLLIRTLVEVSSQFRIQSELQSSH